MSYPRDNRVPYGMTGVPTVGGVPGMTGVAGMPAGMTAVPGMTAMPGMSRVSNGMGGLYPAEKPSSLYPGGAPGYPGLAQTGYLAQVSSPNAPQAGYLAAAQHPGGYLTATNPSTQQRYMVSPAYPGGAGYSLTAGGYALSPQLSGQSSTLAQAVPVATSTLASPTQSQYPTYIGSQLGPMQISPSQNPYAAAASATGHPLYPSSYTGLPIQQASVQPGAPVPAQIQGRLGPAYSSATGLPLGYPY